MTPEQLALIKAAILADPVLAAFPMDSNGHNAIKNALNTLTNPAVTGWRTNAPLADVLNALAWDKYTPAVLPPSIPGTATLNDVCAQLRYVAQIMLINTKQFNLNTVVASSAGMGGVLDFSKANVRAGIRDAVIQLPTGVNDNVVTAGGASGADVLTMGTRVMTRAESALKGAQVTTGTVAAFLFTWQGELTLDDVRDARELP